MRQFLEFGFCIHQKNQLYQLTKTQLLILLMLIDEKMITIMILLEEIKKIFGRALQVNEKFQTLDLKTTKNGNFDIQQ